MQCDQFYIDSKLHYLNIVFPSFQPHVQINIPFQLQTWTRITLIPCRKLQFTHLHNGREREKIIVFIVNTATIHLTHDKSP